MEEQKKKKLSERLPWILVALLAIGMVLQYWFRPEPVDTKEKEYLEAKQALQARDDEKAQLVIKLQEVRDSSFTAIKNNVVTETIVIEKKHEKIRANIRLLPRSDRVQLFADRYKRR